MIPGIAPAISKKKADDPGGGYSFIITAGSAHGGQLLGYSNGEDTDPAGSLDFQSDPNLTLRHCYTAFGNLELSLQATDIAQYLNDSMSVWVDGVKYTPDVFNISGNYCSITITSSPPNFIPTQQYLIEIK